jgi:hypothetical protein
MATYDITAKNSAFSFSSQTSPSEILIEQIDDTHILAFYDGGSGFQLFGRVLSVNKSTGELSNAGSEYSGDNNRPVNSRGKNLIKLDATHFILFCYNLSGKQPYAYIFSVDTSTWAITNTSALTISNDNGSDCCFLKLDSNHILFLMLGASVMKTRVIEINTSTWAMTLKSTEKSFGMSGIYMNLHNIDSTHVLAIWRKGSSTYHAYGQVLSINTSTWEVTLVGTEVELTSGTSNYISSVQLDTNKFVMFCSTSAKVISVNTSTWVVSVVGTGLTSGNNYNKALYVDSSHCIRFWGLSADYNKVQSFEVNTSDGTITALGTALEYDTTYGSYNYAIDIGDKLFVNTFISGSTPTRYARVFEIALGPANLKSLNTNIKSNIKSYNTNLIANVKSINTNV